MNWVRQRTISNYQALIMTPPQAFEILLNTPEPRRTLLLCDAATALRVSEILGLKWMDLDFDDLRIEVRRAYVWGRFKEPKSKASKAPVPMHPLLAGFLLAWRQKTMYAGDEDLVFPSTRLKGKKPLSASILVQKYLRPAAVKAGVLREGEKVRFGFHNFRHSLASTLVKMKVDPKTVQESLRQAHVTTTLQAVRAIGHGVAAGRPGQVPGTVARRQGAPAHGANSVIILGRAWVGEFFRNRVSPLKYGGQGRS